MASDYTADGQGLSKQRRIDADHTLVFRAEAIRQERTGVHARLSITTSKGAPLAWSNFNVERDEDRVRLCNSAYKHLKGLESIYPDKVLKADLDGFCVGLWEAQVAQNMPELMRGTVTPQPPAFLLRPYILTEGGTIIFAPPGRGKSYTLMMMAVSVDAGLAELWPCKQTRVLFINLERGAKSVADRLGNVNDALVLERYRPLATINARGKSLTDVAAAAERYVKENDVGCVFVDSISRAGVGNLNDNQDVNRICDVLNRMGPAWVGLAHTPRSDETHLYGGIHFEAAADVVVQLLSEQEEDGPLGIGLQITKQNDIGKVPMWIGALEFGATGLNAVRRAKPGEFPEVEQGKKMTMKEVVRQHLADVGAQSATEIARELSYSRQNISELLSHDTRTFEKAGKIGRDQLYIVKSHVS